MKRKQVDVILIEVDMSQAAQASCSACDVAKQQLTKALQVVEPLLNDVNVDVRVNNVVVSTDDQARQLQFRGSPTLRVGGFEVAPEHVPNSEDRRWQWGAQDYTVPPVGLFVDAILRGWAGAEHSAASQPYAIPEYLAPYLAATRDPAATSCVHCG